MPSPYTTFSPVGRLKRAVRRLDEADKIYGEVVAVGDKLKTSKEGQKILQYSKTEQLEAWRAKTWVRKVRVGLRQEGWFKSKVAPILPALKDKTALRAAESRAKHFFLDAVNTSVKAAQVIAMSPEDWKDNETMTEDSEPDVLYSAVCVLQTQFEEEEWEEEEWKEDALPGGMSFTIASETNSLS